MLFTPLVVYMDQIDQMIIDHPLIIPSQVSYLQNLSAHHHTSIFVEHFLQEAKIMPGKMGWAGPTAEKVCTHFLQLAVS